MLRRLGELVASPDAAILRGASVNGYSVSETQPSPYLMGNAPTYGSQYDQAPNFHNQNYNQILGGYQQSQQNIGQGFGGIASGYGNLSNQVQGTIAGVGASQLQAIQDQYAKASGSQAQALINSGLGNTTVSSSVQRGLTLDSQKAQVALANQMAQLQAGYQAQLGSAGLQAQSQGLGLQAQGSNVQQGVLGGQHLPFPNYPPGGRTTTQQQQGGAGSGISGNPNGGTNGYWAAGSPSSGMPQQTPFGGGMPNPFGYNPATGQGSSQGVPQGMGFNNAGSAPSPYADLEQPSTSIFGDVTGTVGSGGGDYGPGMGDSSYDF